MKLSEKFEFAAENATRVDMRTRRYIAPKKVLWTSAEDGGSVVNSEGLLRLREGQSAVGTGGGSCILTNEPGMANAAVLVDFGVEMHASLKIYIHGLKADKTRVDFRLRFGESVTEALTPCGERGATNDHANREVVFSTNAISANETTQSGFRFVYLELLEPQARVELKALEAVLSYRDIEYRGFFESSDALLNKIWDVAAYTVHLNMQEYLWDGIKRDRLVWIGDMYPEVQTILSSFGYCDVVPKSLDYIRDYTPEGKWMNNIPSYSMWWILIQYQWYMHTGDISYLRENGKYLAMLIKMLVSYIDENGIEKLPSWRFIDWPTSKMPEVVHAGLQGLLRRSMLCGGFMARELGDGETADICEKAAAALAKPTLSPEAYGNCKQGAALQLMGGLCDANEASRIVSAGGAKGFSTFMGYNMLTAISECGNIQAALDCAREYWGAMLKLGATTFWEDFNIDWAKNAAPLDSISHPGKDDIHADFGDYCYKGLRHSLCHGWSSGVNPWLSHNILGVKLLEPGCRRVSVKPRLADLTFVRGSYPTPLGNIEISAEKVNGKTVCDVKAPKGIIID